MKINWKARFKNPTFVITFTTLVVSFVYQILAIFGIFPTVSENDIINAITLLVNGLATIGVMVDPTTNGVSDSDRALTYYTENDVREVEE